MTLFVAATLNCAHTFGMFFGAALTPDPMRPAACGDALRLAAATAVDVETQVAAVNSFADCMRDYNHDLGLSTARTVGDLVLIGSGVYMAQSWQRRRFGRIGRYHVPARSGLATILERVVTSMGLRTVPQVHRDFGAPSTAFVYGSQGEPHLVLGPGLIRGAESTDDAVRATVGCVVAHELAHLRNGDLRLYYGAQAQFLTVTLASALPVLIFLLNGVAGMVELARFVAVLVIGLVALRAMLRGREHHADLRAVAESEPAAYLQALQQIGHHTQGVRRSVRDWLAQPIRTHPSLARRLQVLEQPERLDRFGVMRAGLVGCAAGIGGTSAITFSGLLLSSTPGERLAVVIAGVVVGIPIGGGLAREIWRAVYIDTQTDTGTVSTLLVGLGLASGTVVGFALGGGPAVPRLTQDTAVLLVAMTAAWFVFALWAKWTAVIRFHHDDPERDDRSSYRTVAILGGFVGAVLMTMTFGVWTRIETRLVVPGVGHRLNTVDIDLRTALNASVGGHVLAATALTLIPVLLLVFVAIVQRRTQELEPPVPR